VFISYGKQSNDRLLQYYGFVDEQNVVDSYDWGVGVLELLLQFGDEIDAASPFSIESVPGKTTIATPQQRIFVIAQALENTPLYNNGGGGGGEMTEEARTTRLYRSPPILEKERQNEATEKDAVDEVAKILQRAATRSGSRSIAARFDDLTVRALRALYSAPEEWERLFPAASKSPPTLTYLGVPLSISTEEKLEKALKGLLAAELASKPTTLEEDAKMLEEAMQRRASDSPNLLGGPSTSPSGLYEDTSLTALIFRMEKKRLLKEVLAL
jgi:hypothetical protein